MRAGGFGAHQVALAGVPALDLAVGSDLEALSGAAMRLQLQFWLRCISRHCWKSSPDFGALCALRRLLQFELNCLLGRIPPRRAPLQNPSWAFDGARYCDCWALDDGWPAGWRRLRLFSVRARPPGRAFHARHGFDLALVANFHQQAVHLGTPDFLVRHFAPAMKNHRAHFVAFAEEPQDLALANLIIVFRGSGPKLDFL